MQHCPLPPFPSVATIMAAFAQFDDIFRGLETSAGRLRLQEGGLGYKITSEDPSASSSGTYTLEVEKMRSFEWIK